MLQAATERLSLSIGADFLNKITKMETHPTRKKVLRQGWIYKRGSFYRPWRLKWGVITEGDHAAKPTLSVYNQRDHAFSMVPKYQLPLTTIEIEVPMETVKRHILDRVGLAPLILVQNHKKHVFAFNTRKERDEWIQLIQSLLITPTPPKPVLELPPHDPVHTVDTESLAESTFDSSHLTLPMEPLSIYDSEVLTVAEISDLGKHPAKSWEEHEAVRQKVAPHPPQSIEPSKRMTHMDNWNDIYQLHLAISFSNKQEEVQKDIRICEIIGNFKDLAQSLAGKIIDEYHSKQQQYKSSSQPQRPETWVYGNVLFYMASNYSSSSPLEIEECTKKTAHELLGIKAINSTSCDLHTALMCLVDYKGFRLVCYAVMPLEESKTPVLDVTAETPLMDITAIEKLGEACEKLNLKEHSVAYSEGKSIQLRGSCTAEVHYCRKNDHYYVLNLCDLFPVDLHKKDKPKIDFNKRLRPEFVLQYSHALSSDAFTDWVEQSPDKHNCDTEVIYASRYLRENHIPQFVKKLDGLEFLPYDAQGFSNMLHASGINIRYLGLISKYTKLPYVKELCFVEMIGRSCKFIFNNLIRTSLLNFKRIEATKIDDELIRLTVEFFNHIMTANVKLWNEICTSIQRKFNFIMNFEIFKGVHRPALFLSMQHHCGVSFKDTMDYDFTSTSPLQTSHFIAFNLKVKQLPTQACELSDTVSPEEQCTYDLARYLASMGPKAKLTKNNYTALKFNALALHYLNAEKYNDALLYGTVAVNLSSKNHAGLAKIYMNLCRATFLQTWNTASKETALVPTQGVQQQGFTGSHDTLVGALSFQDYFQLGIDVVTFHWGSDHPLLIDIYNTMSTLFKQVNQLETSLEFLKKAMLMSYRILGKNHVMTATHLLHSGALLLSLKKIEEAMRHLTEALSIFSSMGDNQAGKAQTLVYLAECQGIQGDLASAKANALEAKQLREKLFGPYHILTCDSYAQVAHWALANDNIQSMVVTNQIRQDVLFALDCYQKIFKFHKHHLHPNNLAQKKKKKDDVPLEYLQYKNLVYVDVKMKNALLLSLTRTMLNLKFRLLSFDQANLLRSARQNIAQGYIPNLHVKDVMLRLVGLTPIVFLEDCLSRAEDGDSVAIDELTLVVQLADQKKSNP